MMDSRDFVQAVGKMMCCIDPALKGCALDTLYESLKKRLETHYVISECRHFVDANEGTW